MDIDLRQVQLMQLEMFKAVKKLCEKYHIQYYAIGGTLLGAVRHKGFIPWDDDIDIGMTRKEYNRFLEHVSELPEPYEFRYVEIGHRGNIVNRNVGINLPPNVIGKADGKYNLFMDIMVIEGCANNIFRAKLHMLHFLYLRMIYKLSFIDLLEENDLRNSFENTIIKVAKKTKISNKINRSKANKRVLNCMKKYTTENSKYSSILFGRYRFRDIYPTSIWQDCVMLPFEDISICAPKAYHEYLSSIYGENFMSPPKGKEIYTHSVTVEYINN